MTSESRKRRKRMSRGEVATLLRGEIVSGRYKPGDRLPSREELAARIPAGYVTIQYGIGLLEQEGFVVSHHGSGTFVTQYPPHLYHYGMLISEEAEKLRRGQNRFHDTLVSEAELFNATHGPQCIAVFHDIVDDLTRPGFQDLLGMVRTHQLAGVMFPDSPISLLSSDLFAEGSVGRVTAAVPEHHAPGLAHFVPDRLAFLQRAMERLADQGCRRVAVLTTGTNMDASGPHYPRRVAEMASRYGISTQPYWTLPLYPEEGSGVRCVVNLLVARPPEERPDGLIVEDDHMIEAAALGLMDAGIETPPVIVGYCNFPDTPPSVLPYIPLGLDCREMVASMIATIDAQVAGQSVAPLSLASPIFAEEFADRYSRAGKQD